MISQFKLKKKKLPAQHPAGKKAEIRAGISLEEKIGQFSCKKTCKKCNKKIPAQNPAPNPAPNPAGKRAGISPKENI